MLRLMVCLALFTSFARGYGTEAVGEGPGINETGVDAFCRCCCLWENRLHTRAMSLKLICTATHVHRQFELRIGRGAKNQGPVFKGGGATTRVDRNNVAIACPAPGGDVDVLEFDITCALGDRGKYPVYISGREKPLTYIYVFNPDRLTNPKLVDAKEKWPGKVLAVQPRGPLVPLPGNPAQKGNKETSVADDHGTEVSIWIQAATIKTLLQSDVPNCGWGDCKDKHQCGCETCRKIPAEKGKIHECYFPRGINEWTLLKDVVDDKERFCFFGAVNQCPDENAFGFPYYRYQYDFRDNLLQYQLWVCKKKKVYPPEETPPNDPRADSDHDVESTPTTQPDRRYRGPPLGINDDIYPSSRPVPVPFPKS